MVKVLIVCILAILTGCQAENNTENVCSSFCSALGLSIASPGKSCYNIHKINKATRGMSGLYYINTTTGVHEVYCDMELDCGGHKGGWMRVADLDINGGSACPTEWANVTVNSKQMCEPPSNEFGCYGTRFSVNGTKYTKVCGQARGYQKGTPGAFSGGRSITNGYVDGLSITIQGPADGDQHRHVWTYAAGHNDHRNTPDRNCPCASFPGPNPDPFVLDHYYCESGDNTGNTAMPNMYFTDDALWDGNDCGTKNNCCSAVGMPWFFRQFPVEQQDDLVARLCQDEVNEGSPIDILQLYVR